MRNPLADDLKKHPAAHLVASPHLASVMQLIELAVYLRSCAKLRGYDDVVRLLHVPTQFSTARMQLALAHRFIIAGAQDVELEPKADGGRKADIFFRYDGRSHLVECYEPFPSRNSHHEDLLHQGVQRILKVARAAGRRVLVRIDIPGDLSKFDAAMRKRVEQEASHLIGKLGGARSRQSKTLTNFEIEVIDTSGVTTGEVKKLAFSLGKPGGWIVAPGQTNKSVIADIPRGADPQITHLGWFVINAKQPDPVEAMERIVGAIESKISQVRRRSEDVLGLMVTITNFARLASMFKTEARPLVEALHRKVLASHEGLAGVKLVDHVLGKDSVEGRDRGPYLAGLFMVGREGRHLEGLHSAISLRESRRRVLDDWT